MPGRCFHLDRPSLKELFDRLNREFPRELTPGSILRLLSENEEQEDPPVVVGISGGADSLFLLLWLRAYYPKLAKRAVALHFNHRTRPGENEREAELVASFTERMDFSLRTGTADREGRDVEGELREARFGYFQTEMMDMGSKILLLGHHADDVVETFLTRAARGSGPEGLAAPRPVSRHRGEWEHFRLRPLLKFSASSIREFLTTEGIPYVVDPSNNCETHLRNRLRKNVIPAWKTASDRDLLHGVSRSREQLEEVAELLEVETERHFPNGLHHRSLPLKKLRRMPAAVVRFVIQRWIVTQDFSVGPETVDKLLQALQDNNTGRWSVGVAEWLSLGDEFLEVSSRAHHFSWKPQFWTPGVALYLPDGSVLRRNSILVNPKDYLRVVSGAIDEKREAVIQLDAAVDPKLSVRLWQAGDRYQPLGASGSRKLQDCFTDRKIDINTRRKLPIILSGDKIIWIPGLPPAERVRVRGKQESLLSLTYEPS